MALEAEERATLRKFIVEHFSINDLKDLVFDVGVNCEYFQLTSIKDFSRDLIIYFEKRKKISCLIQEILKRRYDDFLRELLIKLPQCIRSVKLEILISGDLKHKITDDLLESIALALAIRKEQIEIVGTAWGSLRILIVVPLESIDQVNLSKTGILNINEALYYSIKPYESLEDVEQKAWRNITTNWPPKRINNEIHPSIDWQTILDQTKTVQKLNILKDRQAEIESVLQAKRPSFLPTLHSAQQTFATLNQKAASLPNDEAVFMVKQHRIRQEIGQKLDDTANALLKLFFGDEPLTEINRQPEGEERFSNEPGIWDYPALKASIPLKGITNQFDLLLSSMVFPSSTHSPPIPSVTDSEKDNKVEGVITSDLAKPSFRVRPGLDIPLSEIEEALLSRLFEGYNEILIENELTGGYVARVLLIIPYRKEMKEAPQAVKIGPATIMRDEKRRFDQYVNFSLPLLAVNVIGYAEYEALGAIVYPYLRDNVLGNTLLLKDYYLAHSATQILPVLEVLLKDGLGDGFFNSARPANRSVFYQDLYARYIVPDLELVVDEIGTRAFPEVAGYRRFTGNKHLTGLLQANQSGQMIQLDQFLFKKQIKSDVIISHQTEPVRVHILSAAEKLDSNSLTPGSPVWVRGKVQRNRHQILEDIVAAIASEYGRADVDINDNFVEVDQTKYANPLTLHQDLLLQEMPDNFSLTHGDLHMFNVIVDRHHRPYLIDFGQVGVHHRLFDFIELEVHLRHAILGEVDFAAKDWLDFEQRLLCALLDIPSDPPPHPDLKKAFQVIDGTHQLARIYAHDYPGFAAEYLPALFLYSLATLKFHESNGALSAFHAFLTCTAIGAYLQDKLVCTAAVPAMTITDPTVEFHAYYLRRSAGDTVDAEKKRHAQFLKILQQTADDLREWLDLPPIEVVWADELLETRREMALQYFSGPWQHRSSSVNVVLLAYQMNDSYLLRTAVYQSAANLPPHALTDLQTQFPWQPDRVVPEYLGEQIYIICQSDTHPDQLAQHILTSPVLPHSHLTCGELYAPLSLNHPYLLIYQNDQQEALAKKAFDSDILELGWYMSKVFQQERIYEMYLYPAVHGTKTQLNALLDQAGKWIRTAQSADPITAQISQLVHELDKMVFGYNELLTTARNILDTVKTNVKNFIMIIESGIHVQTNAVDNLFTAKHRQLQRAYDQIQEDLERWEDNLITVERTRDILRTRLTPASHLASIKPIESITLLTANAFFLEATITIMFDDIVDSTGYIQTYGDQQWQRLVKLHDELMYPIIQHYDGRVVNQLEDGHLSIFTDATKAIQAALDIRTALQAQNALAGTKWQLPVRIGLHTGKALVGNTVLGLAVNLAARVCGTAVAGEVLISGATYELGGLETAVFTPHKAQALKGFTHPVSLYRAR